MQIKSKTLLLVAALAALTVLTASAVAQENAAMRDTICRTWGQWVKAAPWSYAERENPRMRMHERWEMVPVAGRAAAAVSASAMTRRERCAALMAAKGLMHDHRHPRGLHGHKSIRHGGRTTATEPTPRHGSRRRRTTIIDLSAKEKTDDELRKTSRHGGPRTDDRHRRIRRR